MIDGGGRSRLFTLLAGAALELTGVNCTNGRATTLSPTPTIAPSGPSGGAFYAGGASNRITLVGAYVINCTVDGRESAGGAIFLFDQSSTTLSGCTFDGCVATASGDGSRAVRAAHRFSRRVEGRTRVRAGVRAIATAAPEQALSLIAVGPLARAVWRRAVPLLPKQRDADRLRIRRLRCYRQRQRLATSRERQRRQYLGSGTRAAHRSPRRVEGRGGLACGG